MVHLEHIDAITAEELHQLADSKAVSENLKDIFPHPYTLKHAEEFIIQAGEGSFGHVFGIFSDKTFIGIGSIIPQKDIYKINGEIGYWIGEPYWGKGYGTQTVKLLTDYAFTELKLGRIFAGVISNNPASMKVLEKSGYRLEAILKSSVIKNGTILDEYIYSIIDRENLSGFR